MEDLSKPKIILKHRYNLTGLQLARWNNFNISLIKIGFAVGYANRKVQSSQGFRELFSIYGLHMVIPQRFKGCSIVIKHYRLL